MSPHIPRSKLLVSRPCRARPDNTLTVLSPSATADGSSELPVGLDLQNFTNLTHLGFRLGPGLREDTAALEALRATLLSWSALIDRISPRRAHSQADPPKNRYLHLGAWWRAAFTREEYVALLRTLGAIIEDVLVRSTIDPTGSKASDTPRTPSQPKDATLDTDPCLVTVVIRDLGDRLDWEDWWSTQIVGCFPTFSTWNRLVVQVTHAGTRTVYSTPWARSC